MNMADTSLVDRHLADSPDGSGATADFHLLVLHSNQLLFLRSNLDRADFHRGNIVRLRRRRRRRRSAAIGIYRFELHAAIWRDPGFVGLVCRMHWIDPVEDFAAALVSGCRRAAFYGLVDVAARKRGRDHREQTDYSNSFH